MTFVAVIEGDAGTRRADPDAPTAAIRARWAATEIDSSHRSEVRSPIREFDTDNGPGEAYLHEDGTCLYTDVWKEDAIRLAITFRRPTPMHLDPAFRDERYIFDTRLHARTTEAEPTAPVNTPGVMPKNHAAGNCAASGYRAGEQHHG
ncbi:hypothetical protein [Streptomyces sp. NPDC091217]|uniref:hypothetical protein n=1 Tax=Streptomyces sp. NPDC091217 TaxID=3365975 RepID=UPI00382AF1B9